MNLPFAVVPWLVLNETLVSGQVTSSGSLPRTSNKRSVAARASLPGAPYEPVRVNQQGQLDFLVFGFAQVRRLAFDGGGVVFFRHSVIDIIEKYSFIYL